MFLSFLFENHNVLFSLKITLKKDQTIVFCNLTFKVTHRALENMNKHRALDNMNFIRMNR